MTPRTSDRQHLLDLYAQHPLREETILARIVRQRGTLDGLTELDLALDSLTEITDQNHVGGVVSVVQLALRAGVTSTSSVLDLGAGLGGSARALAYLFGCRVDGVELSPVRCADSSRLTDRVRLGDLVTCACDDILSVELPARRFDVVWGQGAWMHIADTSALFQRAAGALAAGGRIAFEEACLSRAPQSDPEARVLQTLERLWGGRFISRKTWEAELVAAGFEISSIDDLSDTFVVYFERLAAIAGTQRAAEYPAHETEAFAHAITLAKRGVIVYLRFVARR